MDRGSLDLLGTGVGRQVLIERSGERVALYTIVERLDAADRAAHVGTAGLARLEPPTGEPPPPLKAALETAFTEGDAKAPVRLREQLLGDAATGLAVLAPHGGSIEPGTDDQAKVVFEALSQAGKSVRAWIARGFNPTVGAHTCWHITASEISEQSFPKLGALFGAAAPRGAFSHAVAFHGQNDTEAVVVGGGRPQDAAHTALKTKLASELAVALRAVMDEPPPVVVQPSGPLAGVEPANIVNRVTAAGNGIQLEQPATVRKVTRRRVAIASAVAAFYADLI